MEQSYEKAAEYYQRAADKGIVSCMYKPGNFYENSVGVEQSYEKAAEYYRLAADQGYEKAVDSLN